VSNTLEKIRELVAAGSVRISDHGYDELAADGLLAGEVLAGVANSDLVEDYPQYAKGPCVLLLQADNQGRPIHAVWGIPKGRNEPAVLVTAYRPDPDLWENGFLRRRP
jgi:hypothetical protein